MRRRVTCPQCMRTCCRKPLSVFRSHSLKGGQYSRWSLESSNRAKGCSERRRPQSRVMQQQIRVEERTFLPQSTTCATTRTSGRKEQHLLCSTDWLTYCDDDDPPGDQAVGKTTTTAANERSSIVIVLLSEIRPKIPQ